MNNLSIKGAIGASLVPFTCLALFYSLAVHMYMSFGGWPRSIGTGGFNRALSAHADIQVWWLEVVGLASFYVWPVAVVLCSAIPRARRLLPYLAIYALTALVCYGLMQLAPGPFLYWWRD